MKLLARHWKILDSLDAQAVKVAVVSPHIPRAIADLRRIGWVSCVANQHGRWFRLSALGRLMRLCAQVSQDQDSGRP